MNFDFIYFRLYLSLISTNLEFNLGLYWEETTI